MLRAAHGAELLAVPRPARGCPRLAAGAVRSGSGISPHGGRSDRHGHRGHSHGRDERTPGRAGAVATARGSDRNRGPSRIDSPRIPDAGRQTPESDCRAFATCGRSRGRRVARADSGGGPRRDRGVGGELQRPGEPAARLPRHARTACCRANRRTDRRGERAAADRRCARWTKPGCKPWCSSTR